MNLYNVIPLSLTEGNGPAGERITFVTGILETATAAGNMSVLNLFW